MVYWISQRREGCTMPKRMRVWDVDKYNRYIREGRGQGEGLCYSPWVQVQDFASHGTISRIAGSKTGRVHHFMSSMEKSYFYLLEWSDDVLDIREQYPLLDMELALDLAGKAGIRYPRDPVSGFPYVLTCDFMITAKQGLKARTIKQSSELNNPRTLEKLELERRYWKSAGVDWRVVTEREIPVKKAKNIEWLHTARCFPDEVKNLVNGNFLYHLEALCGRSSSTPFNTGACMDQVYGLPSGTALQAIRYLLWTKQLPCALDSEIQLYPHASLAS